MRLGDAGRWWWSRVGSLCIRSVPGLSYRLYWPRLRLAGHTVAVAVQLPRVARLPGVQRSRSRGASSCARAVLRRRRLRRLPGRRLRRLPGGRLGRCGRFRCGGRPLRCRRLRARHSRRYHGPYSAPCHGLVGTAALSDPGTHTCRYGRSGGRRGGRRGPSSHQSSWSAPRCYWLARPPAASPGDRLSVRAAELMCGVEVGVVGRGGLQGGM